MASLKGDNLVVLYYRGTSEIRPDEKGRLWLEGPYKRGTTVFLIFYIIEIGTHQITRMNIGIM